MDGNLRAKALRMVGRGVRVGGDHNARNARVPLPTQKVKKRFGNFKIGEWVFYYTTVTRKLMVLFSEQCQEICNPHY